MTQTWDTYTYTYSRKYAQPSTGYSAQTEKGK